ncbi:MAG: 8-amino-7-oxononanoate synthase [SAR324 cluster bacterium]|nr:8-amino-7-oxononanoate synthase [SAR324 cluster bacterium]
MNPFSFISQALEQRQAVGRLRILKSIRPLVGSKVILEGKELLNLSSNDFLGLSEHPLLGKRAGEFAFEYGAGSRASRLVTGNITPFCDLEKKIATLKQMPASLIFNAGYQANASLVGAFVTKKSLVLMDRLSHNSLIQGATASGARVKRFLHNDLTDLERQLKSATGNYDRILVITESVFSMDGDLADLQAIQKLATEYGAMFFVDEAHATGVMGESGMGLSVGQNIDLVMGTFGKGMGSFGAYLCCSTEVREYLINFCAGFIYTTALPPQVLGAIDAALELVPTMEIERQHLREISQYFRDSAQGLGYDTGESASQIVPIILGSEEATMAAQEFLLKKGFLAVAIRPPTVEIGKSRLRFAFNSRITKNDIIKLLEALDEFRKK